MKDASGQNKLFNVYSANNYTDTSDNDNNSLVHLLAEIFVNRNIISGMSLVCVIIKHIFIELKFIVAVLCLRTNLI